MHDQQYCILNKKYSEEEYNALVPKIIEHMKTTGEWGEFFPKEIAIHGYNKTSAQMYYPLTSEEALSKKLSWDDSVEESPNATKVIQAQQLPDNIKDTPDDILNWAIACEVTGKPFKIQKKELEFYREQTLPIPHKCREQRHYNRFMLRNPRKMWSRECAKCSKEMRTTYASDRPETVYCEECYSQTVY